MTEICKRLSDKEIKALTNIIQNWKFECKQCKDFSKAQVMLGGVNGSEVNNYTFESKIVKIYSSAARHLIYAVTAVDLICILLLRAEL